VIQSQAWTLVVLLATAAVALICGLTISPEAHYLAAALGGISLLGVVWPWITIHGIRGEMFFSRSRCTEGQQVEVVVTLWNRWPWPMWGLSIERGFFELPNSGGNTASGLVLSLARIPGWTKSVFRWQFVPECRGVYPHTTPKIRTDFPFGVSRRECAITVQEKIVVWPATLPARRGLESRGEDASLVAMSTRKSGSEGEFVSARPFRQGDRLRHVHWNLTARFDRLIVTEHQGHGQSGAVVQLCRDSTREWIFDRQEADEWSIRIVASVCELLLQQNVHVRLVLNQVSTEILGTPVDRRRGFDRLAQYCPVDSAPHPKHSTRLTRRVSRPESHFVVCTDLTDLPENISRKTLIFLIQSAVNRSSMPEDFPGRIVYLDPVRMMEREFEQAWNSLTDEVWHGRPS